MNTLILALAVIGVGPSGIDIDFRSQDYDRWMFRTSSGGTRGRWDTGSKALRASLPKGPVGRAALKFYGQFRLEGDFEIVVDYELVNLPKPRQAGPAAKGKGGGGDNAVELIVSGAGFAAAVVRSNGPKREEFGYFASPPGKDTATGSVAARAKAGQMALRRSGERLTLAAADGKGPSATLGEVEFGAMPIEEVALQVVARETTDAVEVRFLRLRVMADRLTPSESPPPPAGRIGRWSALVLGAAAITFVMHRIRRARGPRVGRIQGRRAFTLIELLVVIAVIGILVGLLLPAIQAAREASRRASCQNNLRQIGLALANYESTYQVYPFGVGGAALPGHTPRWSIQSQLLPFLELGPLYNAVNFVAGVPWLQDAVLSPMNQTALGTKAATFLCPSDTDRIAELTGIAHNNYRGAAGSMPYNLLDSPDGTGRNDGMFWYQSAVRVASIVDGTSQSAAFSERCLGVSDRPDALADYYLVGPTIGACAAAGPVTTPRYTNAYEWSGERWGDGNAFYTRYQHVFPPMKPSCMLGGTEDYDSQDVVTATSRHPGGVNLLTADGSLRFVKATVAGPVWKALGTIAGGEVIGQDQY